MSLTAQAVKPNSRNALLFEDWLIRQVLAREKKSAAKIATTPPTSAPPSRASSTLLLARGVGEDGAEDEAAAETAIAKAKVPEAGAAEGTRPNV